MPRNVTYQPTPSTTRKPTNPPNNWLHKVTNPFTCTNRLLRYHRPSTAVFTARHATFQVPLLSFTVLSALRADICCTLVCILQCSARKVTPPASACEEQRTEYFSPFPLCLHHHISYPWISITTGTTIQANLISHRLDVVC